VDAAPALLSYWDVDQRNLAANATFAPWCGVDPSDIHGIRVNDVLGDEVYEANLPHIRRVLSGVPQQFRRSVVDASGTARRTQSTYVPDVAGGRVIGFSVLVTDITPFFPAGILPTIHLGAERSRADEPRRVRALVVDADTLARAGISTILGSAPGIEVVGEVAGAEQALPVVRDSHPDVIVIDAWSPGAKRLLETKRSFSNEGSAFPELVVFTSTALDVYLFDPLGAGAARMLTKQAPPEELIEAVRAAAAGARAATVQGQGLRWRPTAREREVLELAVRGMATAEMAQRLHVSVDTVKSHLKNLYGKLGLHSRLQLIAAAAVGPREDEVGG
jgi:DNA-binding NarL/FixJ family response regulator